MSIILYANGFIVTFSLVLLLMTMLLDHKLSSGVINHAVRVAQALAIVSIAITLLVK